MAQMWFHLFKQKYFAFTLCFSVLELLPEQTSGKLWIQKSSPDLTVVAKGQPLQLNITLHGADETVPMLLFIDWNFRANPSSSVKRLLSLTWDRGYVVSETFYDERASTLDIASLLLLDTSLMDGGTYWCNMFSLPSHQYPLLYFNVTVQGKPTAEIACPEQVNVTQGKNFSCWCNARSGYLTAKTSWQLEGASSFLGGKRKNGSVELFLGKVKKHMTGTYLCTAQLFSMKDEKKLILSVFYAPTIHFFRGKFLKDNSMKLTCLAKGFPPPTYVIKFSSGSYFNADIHGVLIINDCKPVINETLTCIAKNVVGRDQWNLNGMLAISKDETVKNQKSFLQDHVWYIIGVSVVAGILLGIILLKTCQSTVCKNRDAENEQDSPVYVDPATLPISEGRKKDPFNYIDVPVLSNTTPQERIDENMPVYVDPDTVVSSRKKLKEARGEDIQESKDVRETPKDKNQMYQAPYESREDENGESDIEDNQAEEDSQANQVDEEIQADPADEEITNRESNPPINKPRANTEPMLGYQDLDSSDEIEENFYHSLRSTQPVTEYYVNERVKVKE